MLINKPSVKWHAKNIRIIECSVHNHIARTRYWFVVPDICGELWHVPQCSEKWLSLSGLICLMFHSVFCHSCCFSTIKTKRKRLNTAFTETKHWLWSWVGTRLLSSGGTPLWITRLLPLEPGRLFTLFTLSARYRLSAFLLIFNAIDSNCFSPGVMTERLYNWNACRVLTESENVKEWRTVRFHFISRKSPICLMERFLLIYSVQKYYSV